MARRKNTKFIDPRYFMDEKMERLDEGGGQSLDGQDYGFRGEERLKFNKAMREDPEAREFVSSHNMEEVIAWFDNYKPPSGDNSRRQRRDSGHPFDFPPGQEGRYKYSHYGYEE
jgi:hypothetical protein